MKRKLLGIVAMLALCLLAAPAIVSAAPRATPEQGTVALDNGGNCSDPNAVLYGDNGRWAGYTNSSSGSPRSGVKGFISWDTSITGFRKCKPNFPFDIYPSGAYVYLEIYPRNAVGGCATVGAGNNDCFIRLGVARCTVGTSGFAAFKECNQDTGETQPAYQVFMHRKGCGQSQITHNYSEEIPGVTATNGAEAYFYQDTDGATWRFFYNGVSLGSINDVSDARVNCWLNDMPAAGWAFRYWDHQDSIATQDDPTPNTFINGARYGVAGTGWINPFWSEGPCLAGAWSVGSGGQCERGNAGDNDKIGAETYD